MLCSTFAEFSVVQTTQAARERNTRPFWTPGRGTWDPEEHVAELEKSVLAL